MNRARRDGGKASERMREDDPVRDDVRADVRDDVGRLGGDVERFLPPPGGDHSCTVERLAVDGTVGSFESRRRKEGQVVAVQLFSRRKKTAASSVSAFGMVAQEVHPKLTTCRAMALTRCNSAKCFASSGTKQCAVKVRCEYLSSSGNLASKSVNSLASCANVDSSNQGGRRSTLRPPEPMYEATLDQISAIRTVYPYKSASGSSAAAGGGAGEGAEIP